MRRGTLLGVSMGMPDTRRLTGVGRADGRRSLDCSGFSVAPEIVWRP